MPAFPFDSLATIIAAAAVLAVCALALRSLLRDRKKGGSCSCGASCGACGGCALGTESPSPTDDPVKPVQYREVLP